MARQPVPVPHDTDADLSGEQLLLAAILQQAIRDATSKGYDEKRRWQRQQAQAWLRQRAVVEALLELAGLEPEVYALVIEAAHLEGERHEP